VVIINKIDRQAFHELLPLDVVRETAVGEEVEWFADVTETIIGTVEVGDKGWSYALLKRYTTGKFQVCERLGNFSTQHTAQLTLLQRMVGTNVAGLTRIAA